MISWPRLIKRSLVLMLDAAICAVAVLISFYLRLGAWPPIASPVQYAMAAAVAFALPLFIISGLYRAIFRYAGAAAMVTIARTCAIFAIPFVSVFTFIGVGGVPRTVGIIAPLIVFLLVAASRLVAQAWLGSTYRLLWQRGERPRAVIYGAGSAGRQLASAIRASTDMTLVGFVDDNPALAGATMAGARVYEPSELDHLIARRRVSDVLLAIPSATRSRRGEIVGTLAQRGLHVRTLPSVTDIARGRVSIEDLKDVAIEDLLARSSIAPDEALLTRDIADRVVLVTGAGGSIGSELCRQILAIGPANLLLVDSNEFALYAIHQELQRQALRAGQTSGLVPLLASVRDERRMRAIVAAWQPHTIYHAAAYKHVPLVEHNPVEGAGNNVLGTLVLAQLARDCGVASFVLVSTDKAVRPTNVMGATKRLAEMILQALAKESGDVRFTMVRFGNVLGSSGSVVPLFNEQIAAGGPVTVTHPDVTRYFMTIPEAAQLVIQAGAMGGAGEVFVLDMGAPIRIADLARKMIELSGLTVRDEHAPDGDIEIEYCGLRPGEKLFEELLIGDNPRPTPHPRIAMANEDFLSWPVLTDRIERLAQAIDAGDAPGVRKWLAVIVPEFQPVSADVDWITQQRGSRLH